jgi:hypothetical protein
MMMMYECDDSYRLLCSCMCSFYAYSGDVKGIGVESEFLFLLCVYDDTGASFST